jgi:hypothetical protein
MFNSAAYTSSVPVGTGKAIIISSDGESNASANGQNPSPTHSDATLNSMATTDAQNAWRNYGISVFVVLYYHGSDTSDDITELQSLVQGSGFYTQESDPTQLPAALDRLFSSSMFGILQ